MGQLVGSENPVRPCTLRSLKSKAGIWGSPSRKDPHFYLKKRSKLTVIPTTAGSGAEVTSNAVIYVDGIKHSFESEILLPDNFFLIPEFLISAPSKIKASAGFDAIAQALESLVSKKSNNESVDFALKSLKISNGSYVSFLNNPKFHYLLFLLSQV